MRISDWSSDVCSSDLDPGHLAARNPRLFARRDRAGLWPLRDDPPGPAALARAARELAEGPATLVVGALSPPDPAPAVDVVRPPPGDPGQGRAADDPAPRARRSEEHTSELQSLMRISYAVFCLKKKKIQ